MKTITILSLACAVLSFPPQACGQEPVADIPVTKTDEAAAMAFQEWASGLPLELEYPVQIHMSVTFTMDMEKVGKGETLQMEVDLQMDILVDGVDAIRSWGKIEMDGQTPDKEIDLKLDYQLGLDGNGLRFLLDDHGFILERFDYQIPKAYYLSADRVETLVDLYFDMMQDVMALNGPEFMEAFAAIEGVGELYHPASMARYQGLSSGLEIVEWGEEDGLILVRTRPNEDYLGQILALQDIPLDLDVLRDMVSTIIFDRETGLLLDYTMPLDMLMEFPVEGTGGMKMHIVMDMRMQTVPVAIDAPLVVLPGPDQVKNLNQSFDQFLPVIKMALEMQMQQMQRMMGEKESGDDYDF